MRYRPMQPNDVPESVEIIAQHPVIGSRYGECDRRSAKAWLHVLSSEAATAVVLHAEEGLENRSAAQR